MAGNQQSETIDDAVLPYTVHDELPVHDPPKPDDDSDEVFQSTVDGVEFRTVGWFRASILFLKVVFAVGVLSLPTTLDSLGAIGGTLCIFWIWSLQHILLCYSGQLPRETSRLPFYR